jgi:hypothetical protein
MRFLYVVLFLMVFAAALWYFKQAREGPERPAQPVEARVELLVPGMT